MEIVSKLFDKKIQAFNFLVEISIKEFQELIVDIVNENEFQRKKVRSSNTVYSLLKEDLKEGCILPSLVLAINGEITEELENKDSAYISDFISSKKEKLVILDGLQRTLNILELYDELKSSESELLNDFVSNTLRLEIYIGISRMGILYRMLTLNTGQTPMSWRHQIEMLYSDYINQDIGDDIEIIKEADGAPTNKISQFIFKELIEGYQAYIDRSHLPINRGNVLKEISNIDKLAEKNIQSGQEEFESFIKSWNKFLVTVGQEDSETDITDEFLETYNSNPFGATFLKVFKKSQAITGFGAAVGKMIDAGEINSINDIFQKVDRFKESLTDERDMTQLLLEMNSSLEWLKNNTTKIGNAQREYFSFFFRELINSNSDSTDDLVSSANSALIRYKSLNT